MSHDKSNYPGALLVFVWQAHAFIVLQASARTLNGTFELRRRRIAGYFVLQPCQKLPHFSDIFFEAYVLSGDTTITHDQVNSLMPTLSSVATLWQRYFFIPFRGTYFSNHPTKYYMIKWMNHGIVYAYGRTEPYLWT